jgi:acetyl-CoA C-acetyltransferase
MTTSVYVVDGARTPFIKQKAEYGPWSATDLAVQCSQALLQKTHFNAEMIDEVITGCAMPSEDEANIARIIALRLGCPDSVPAYTVMRNCASVMQAVYSACQSILSGRAHCVLAIGTEAMSRAPLIYNEKAYHWFSKGKHPLEKLKNLFTMRPNFFKPIISLKQGLTDPLENLLMGQTAEEIAYHFSISKKEMDTYSVQSHHKAHRAWVEKEFKEVVPIADYHLGKVFEKDDGIRVDSSVEKLSTLKPIFEKYGTITAGNSSQVTDGAGALILVSEHLVNKYHLEPLGKITAQAWSGCNPKMMGLGPVRAMAQVLQENNYTFEDIDFLEINEAFAAQVLGCLACFEDPQLGERYGSIYQSYGSLCRDKVNLYGGAIALGHPVGASGVRIILRSLYQLRDHGKKRALASLCIGGGQGGATLVEAA